MPETLMGKYMQAVIQPPEKGKKTRAYQVTEIGADNFLGAIRWYAPWRGYCFFPACGTVFDGGCLLQLSDWLYELNAAHRLEKEGQDGYGRNDRS